MMVLKKKEIIAAALVVLIGMAGYLNWSYQDTVHVRDGESYIETGKKLGEAQYVNSVEEVDENSGEAAQETSENAQTQTSSEEKSEPTSAEANYFEQARLDKEKSRSRSLEILNETAANESFDSEIRKKAGDKILAQAQNIEKESQIESIAQSKGYNEICIYIHDGGAVATVRKEGFNSDDALKITELIQEQTGIQANKIKVVNVE